MRRRWAPVVLVAALAVLGVGVARAVTIGPGSGSGSVDHNAHQGGGAAEASSGDATTGTALSDGSYAFELLEPVAEVGASRVVFAIRDLRSDSLLTRYELEQTKKLHLIAVGADTHGFQHVHPRLLPDGRWVADDLRLDRAGSMRLIADFVPEGEEQRVLATNLLVTGGAAAAEPFVESERDSDGTWQAAADGYRVSLEAAGYGAGQEGSLHFTLERDGQPVTDLEPYLGVLGHSVLLRTGDLAYVHVHPQESDASGPEIEFETTYPSGAPLAIFLQFRHRGAVHTAEFRLPAPPASA